MKLEQGEKYASVCLGVVASEEDLPFPFAVGPGLWVLNELPFDLPDHWNEWLGQLQVDAIAECNLFLFATAGAEHPEVLDAENEELRSSAEGLLWGLVFTDFFRCRHDPVVLTGAHTDAGVDVRSVGSVRRPVHLVGTPLRRMSRDRLNEAAAIHSSLAALFVDQRHDRLRRAVHAFYRGVQEIDAREKLHQFLRVVEGFVLPETRGVLRRLKSRTELFLGPRYHDLVEQWFNARSAIEHLNDVDLAYEGDIRTRRVTLIRNAIELEALSRYCLKHILLKPDLWSWFETDERIASFWALDESTRRDAWGGPLPIDAIQDEIDDRWIRDHHLGLS